MYERHMREALRLASRGRYRTAPNPMVGALVVDRDGAVVGRGYHRRVGGDHAEVHALRQAGAAARGGTLLVTLEPCSHHGRTPPCVDRVVAAGVSRVVCCHADPNPEVSGRGIEALRAAGIAVEVGLLARRAIALNLAFLVPLVDRRAQVTLKWAASLDGKIATAGGESQWISSPAGRRWALDLRETHDAILVGSGTVLADDPSLDRRLGKAAGAITRVVLDRRLRISPAAKLFGLEGPVRIYTEIDDGRAEALRRQGATVHVERPLSLEAVTRDLLEHGRRSVLVEGGAAIHGAFIAAGLFDRVEVCCAPLLIGGDAAPGPVGGPGSPDLASAPRLEIVANRRRGPDRILSAVPSGRLEELAERVERQLER